MTKVYVLTTGDYSDTEVAAVFTTLELAEQAKANLEKHGCTSVYINDRELDPGTVEVGQGLTFYAVNMSRSGNVRSVSEVPYATSGDASTGGAGGSWVGYSWESKWYCAHCWARDEKHAIKIANEWRAQSLANNEAP